MTAACLFALAAVFIDTAQAQESVEEIRITGSRLRQSGMETPTPVTQVTVDELADMNPRQMVDALSQLPQFIGNQRPQNTAALTTGGSNLNLRGLGSTRTLVLINGRRMPSGNRYGAANVSTLPEGAISSVETVTGGASAAYGTDAVAGVVNFILNTDFEGFTGRLQAGETSRGDGDNIGFAATFGTDLGENGHVMMSVDYYDQDIIQSLEALQSRPWFLQRGLVTNPDPNGPRQITRNFVRPADQSTGGTINQPGSALDKLEFVRSGDQIITLPMPFSGVGAVNGGCNCFAEPQRDRSWGTAADNAVQNGNGRGSVFIYTDYDVNENLNVYLQGIFGFSEVIGPWFGSPTLTGPAWQATIFRDNPFLPQNVRDIMDAEGRDRFNMAMAGSTRQDEPGPLGWYHSIQNDRLASGTAGFDLELTEGFLDGWHLAAYAQYGKNNQKMLFRDGIRTDRQFLALDVVTDPVTGSPACRAAVVNPAVFGDCVPINLFGGVESVSAPAASYLLDEEAQVLSTSDQIFSEIVLDGEIHEGFGAGPITMALGASYRRDELRQWKQDMRDEFVYLNGVNTGFRGLIPEDQPNGMLGVRPGSVPSGFIGNASLSTTLFTGSYQTEDTVLAGAFSVKEAFTEFNVPLLQDLPFINRLDSNFGYRYAEYTGSGGITSWKVGLSWEISDELRMRLTRSRDVRAGTLRERYDATAGGANVTDPMFNDARTNTTSRTGGNPNVNPEKADTWTAGFIWQPSSIGFLDGFSSSVDWYYVDLNDAIGQLGFQTIVDSCWDGATELCQYVIRDPASGQITRIDNLFLNISNSRLRGVDVETRYQMDVDWFGEGAESLGWRLFANRIIENSNLLPGAPRDFVGLEQPEWRVTTSLSYSNGPFRSFLQGRWLDGRMLNRRFVEGVDVDKNSVASVFYTDMNLSYEMDIDGQTYRLFGNVTNLLDRAPPLGSGDPSTNWYDTIGRTYTLGVNVAF
ncbi:MAG: TonB-dependent receptor [Pseudomonadales bacterium]|nr:TonB-dependent receptor [Pseudomonadales bacterium]